MSLRLSCLMKCWTLLCVFVFASCIKATMGDVRFLRDEVVALAIKVSEHATGRKKDMDHSGNIIGESACEVDFSEAHKGLLDIETSLKEWPTITEDQIPQSLLKEIKEHLNESKPDMGNPSGGPAQNQFNKAWYQLVQYISNDLSQSATSPS